MTVAAADAEIVAALEADAAEISALAVRTYVDAFGADFDDPQDLRHHVETTLSVERWQGYLQRDRVFLARMGGVSVGYVQFGPSDPDGETEVRRLYVERNWQGQGIGSRLLNGAIAACEASGAATIWIDVWQSNARAQRLYAAHGFVATDQRKPFVLKSGAIDGYDIRMVRRRGGIG